MTKDKLLDEEGCLPGAWLDDITEEQVSWLWENWIPLGFVSLIQGKGGEGKSSVAARIISNKSRGKPLPGESFQFQDPVRSYILAPEDAPGKVVRPRFEANEADLEHRKVKIFTKAFPLNERNVAALKKTIQREGYKIVLIDPIGSYFPADLDPNKGPHVRALMTRLAEIAEECGVAIIIVQHFNKQSAGHASDRGSGSAEFRNAARSVIQVVKTKDSGFVSLEKHNLGPPTRALTYSVTEKWRVEFTGTSDLTANQILQQVNELSPKPSLLRDCREFILATLSKLERPSVVLNEMCLLAGFSEKTIERARSELRREGSVEFKKLGDHSSVWRIKSKDRHSPSDQIVGVVGGVGDDPPNQGQDRQHRQEIQASLPGVVGAT